MKKFIATLIVSTLALTSCGDRPNTGAEGDTTKDTSEKQEINFVTMAINSQQAELISSQLNSVGFDTNIVTTPDYSTYVSELEKNEYDIAITGWTTVTGNPDYAVMSIFHTNGDYNTNGLSNADLDANLELGRKSEIGSDDFVNAYYEVEKIVNENAYIIPLTYSLRTYSITNDLDEDSVEVFKSRSMKLEDYMYTAESGRDSEVDPLKVSHFTITLTSFDPMKANDGTVFAINTNQYGRLVNLGADDSIQAGIAKAYGTDDQTNFYFALRDDAYFSNGEQITPEDVVFSLLRASNKDEVGNRVYSIQGSIANAEEVSFTDIPDTAKAKMEEVGEFSENDKFVKITTKEQYSQLYNMLAHTSGSIVSKKAIEEVGADYGTISNIDKLVVSGPYVVTNLDETTNEITLERNEFYYDKANIKNVIFKVIPEMATSVNALKAGEIDFVYNVTTEQYSVIEDAPNTNLLKSDSNAFNYIQFNLNEGSRASDINFRKAVYNAIDPNVYLQVIQQGNGGIGASTLSPVLNTTTPTGYQRPDAEIDKVSEYLQQYKNTIE